MNICKNCEFWTPNLNYPIHDNAGVCSELKNNDKVFINVQYGWDGGYIHEIETDDDFGCTSFKGKQNKESE